MFIAKELRNTFDVRKNSHIRIKQAFGEVAGKTEHIGVTLDINYTLDLRDTIRFKIKEGQSVYTDTLDILLKGVLFEHNDHRETPWTIPIDVHKAQFVRYFNNLNFEEMGDKITPHFMDEETNRFCKRMFNIQFTERLTELYLPVDPNDPNLDFGRDPNYVSKRPIGTYKIKITDETSRYNHMLPYKEDTNEPLPTWECVIDFQDVDFTVEYSPLEADTFKLHFNLLKSKNIELAKILKDNYINADVFDEDMGKNNDRIALTITTRSHTNNYDVFQVFKTNIVREIFSNL